MIGAQLRDLFTIRKGRKATSVTAIVAPGTKRLLQINDLRGDGVRLYTADQVGVAVEERDIVIAWDGANAGTVGYGLIGHAGSTLAVLRPISSSVFTPYVGRFLQARFQRLNTSAQGAAVPHVSRRVLEELIVPLPSIAEQRRIATMLDKADAVRRKRLESLAVLDGFLGSAFLEFFGDPVRNEKSWVRSEGASAIRNIEAGTSMGGDAQAPGSGDWAVLKISAVTSGWYLPTERKTVSALPDRPIFPKRGDLLFSRANTRDLVAATCLVDRDEDRIFLPDKLWKITANSEVATAEYLRFLFANSGFRRMLTQQATGSSGSMLNVSQDKVLRARLPLPPLDLQCQFADLVWTTYGLRDSMLAASSQANTLLEIAAWQAFRAKVDAD